MIQRNLATSIRDECLMPGDLANFPPGTTTFIPIPEFEAHWQDQYTCPGA